MANNKVSLEDMRRILNMDQPTPEPEKVVAEAKVNDDGKIEIYNSTLKKLSDEVVTYATDNLKPHFAEVITKIADKNHTEERERLNLVVADIQSSFQKSLDAIEARADEVRPIEVRTPDSKVKLKGIQHKQFTNLLKVVGCGQAVLLVGPAGTGKSHGAELVAESLNLSFHAMSVGSQTTKSDIQGYMTATGSYVRTQFREAYEHGGLFLLDEADAGNSNVLIVLNAALSNGYMAFPDGMIKAHPNFRMVATANTYGNGASRQYVGRNQLDAATLDRFAVINWDIDPRVEKALSGGTKEGLAWYEAVKAVRKRAVTELELRVVVSPRATQRGALLLAAGLDFPAVLQIALVGNMPESNRSELENLARAAWNKAHRGE